jgi:cell division protein FtsB
MSVAASQLQLNFAERAVRRRPTSLVLGLLFAGTLFVVAFVSNVIEVNTLGAGIVEVSTQLQRTSDESQALRAEIARLQTADKITVAALAIGMEQPDHPALTLPQFTRSR